MSEDAPPPRRRRMDEWAARVHPWLSDEALTWLLLFLFLDMFVLPMMGPNVGNLVMNIIFTALVFTGLVAVASRGVAYVIVGLPVLCAAVLKWVAPVSDLPGITALAAVSGMAVLVIFTVLVLLRTLSPGPINRHRIEGAVAVYLLIAMAFSLAYELVEWIQPDSFLFSAGEPEAVKQAVGYFSLVTLTTVGYGDVTPVTPLARRLAMLEGFIGQLYPAIIIGWMVGSMKRRED